MKEDNNEDRSDLSRRDFQKLLGVSGAAVLGGVSLAGCQGEQSAAIACPYCDEAFDSESGLKDHLPAAHEDELRAAIGDGPYQCPYGEEEFGDLAALRTHIKETHSGDVGFNQPDEWDLETDVVIVGYGGAGAVAAIEAADNGAEVLVLEKMERGGGSTAMSGGLFLTPESEDSVPEAVDYLLSCAHDQVSEEMVERYAEEAVTLPDWMESLGISDLVAGYSEGYHSQFDGYDAITSWTRESGAGPALFNALDSQVTQRDVEIRTETPVEELYVNPANRVVGVKAGSDGDLNVRARNAVVLTCGGFDYDEDLKKENFRAWPKYSVGNPGNTGDAVDLAAETGADLWKMPEVCGNYCHKFEDNEIAFPSNVQMSIGNKSAFIVNQNGERFTDETLSYDAFHKELNDYDAKEAEFPNIPSYVIFDEATLNAGPIGYGTGWTEDNQTELDKGWITKASDIRSLASEIGVPADNLETTLAEFNEQAAAGDSGPFGREGKQQLETSPVYAVEGYPGLWGTWGGPRIDTNSQVVDTDGDPVPGLYAAGNASCGAFKFLYPVGGGSIGDAFAFGRIAGRQAATE